MKTAFVAVVIFVLSVLSIGLWFIAPCFDQKWRMRATSLVLMSAVFMIAKAYMFNDYYLGAVLVSSMVYYVFIQEV